MTHEGENCSNNPYTILGCSNGFIRLCLTWLNMWNIVLQYKVSSFDTFLVGDILILNDNFFKQMSKKLFMLLLNI